MKELFYRISLSCDEKTLNNIKYDPLIHNLLLNKALCAIGKKFIKNNMDSAVGEIADLIVISVNTIGLMYTDIRNYDLLKDIEKYINSMSSIINDKVRIMQRLNRLVNDIVKNCDFKGIALAESYTTLILNCIEVLKALGYSPELALLEAVKKLESRDDDTYKPTYKPDYSKAKL